ncbi:MAG TPA: ABC transporter permease [Bryobacteraceae bacterium]|nr:ABC transporter permease [Bryobacteraceae bacterium]
MGELWRRIQFLFNRRQFDEDLEEEIRYHLDCRSAEHNSRDAARHRFGNETLIKETSREMWNPGPALGALLQDAKYGVRTLLKNHGFASVAVLTLALGIGASTAVFGVFNAILLKPLPYPEPAHLAMLWLTPPKSIGMPEFPWARRQYRYLTRGLKTVEHFGAFQADSFNLTGAGEPSLVEGLRASAGFFPALGIAPALGRTFTAEEDQPGHEYEVVLSDRLWRDRFASDPSVLGRSVHLNGYSYTVVGVMRPGFAFPRAEEMPSTLSFPSQPLLWVPIAVPADPPGGLSEIAIVARTKPGFTRAQVQADVDVWSRQMDALLPRSRGWNEVQVRPLDRQIVGDTGRPLSLLLGAVGIILLIAASNVASLLLARSAGRRREFTLRAALGAGKGRLIRQLLTESMILSAIGGALGLLAGQLGVHFARTYGPSNIPRLHDAAIDLPVFAFALVVTFATGIFFGLAPAHAAARADLVETLKEKMATAKVRAILVVAEIALAFVLVIAAGLLVRTFYRILSADGGFNPDRVLTFELSLPISKYPDAAHIVPLYQRALDRLQAVPGIMTAGIGATVPVGGSGEGTTVHVLDHPVPVDKQPFAGYTIVSPGYFASVGTSLLRGRSFLDTDNLSSRAVAIVSRAMAEQFWPGQDALGKQFDFNNPRFPVLTVVGIVGNVKHVSLREDPGPEIYVPYTQKVWSSLSIMRVAVRTAADPLSVVANVRQAIHAVDPELPVAKVATLESLVVDSVAQPRFAMALVAAFGALALILASIGMYGVISYSVVQRTREIGVRMALGARRTDVFRLVLGQSGRLVLIGVAIGFAASLAVARTMSSFLYGVTATDPGTFVSVAILLATVVMLASYVPARRAMRVDPMVALRHE